MLFRTIKVSNRISFSHLLLLLLVASVSFSQVGCSSPSQKYVIGAGHSGGYYNSAAKSISKIVNKNNTTFRSTLKTTSGSSVSNIDCLVTGACAFAVAQSDYAYQAWSGTEKWQDRGPQSNLRAVLSLYAESVTLVAADDSGITNIQDLKGKKVNLGIAGSGPNKLVIQILGTAGLDYKKDVIAFEKNPVEGPKLLQQKKIDAFFYVLAHPSSKILKSLSGKRKAHFVPVEGMEHLIEKNPFYAKTVIPIAWYPKTSNLSDVPTIGVKALLVSSKTTPEDIVYSYTKKIIENREELQTLHPALKYIQPKQFIEAISIPMKPGSLQNPTPII